MGVPGPASVGGFGTPLSQAAAIHADYPSQEAFRGYERLDFPQTIDPPRAIGIAADSAIQCCDIALVGNDGEMERHRISPGNPLIGCMEGKEYALISIPNAIPPMLVAAITARTLVWDSVGVAPFTGFAEAGALLAGFPLRLEVWRGETFPMRTHRRAPLYSHAILAFIPEQTDPHFVVCVDGRRRIDVQVYAQDSDVTFTATQLEAMIPFQPVAPGEIIDNVAETVLSIDGNPTATVLDGTMGVFSLEGNPITVLDLKCSGDGSGYVQLRVFAWDD
jgi:hypothetical protein